MNSKPDGGVELGWDGLLQGFLFFLFFLCAMPFPRFVFFSQNSIQARRAGRRGVGGE